MVQCDDCSGQPPYFPLTRYSPARYSYTVGIPRCSLRLEYGNFPSQIIVFCIQLMPSFFQLVKHLEN